MKALKIHVERAVRPVRASERRKDKMREELYAHLLKTYEEEFARLGDEQASVEQAFRRFGEPAEITQALQGSVPRLERILFVRCGKDFEDFFRRKEGESVVRPAARLAVYLGAVQFLLFFVIESALYVVGWAPRRPAFNSQTTLYLFTAGTFLLTAVGVFLFSLLAEGMRQALCREPRTFRSWAKAVGYGALSGFLVFASCLAVAYGLADGISEVVPVSQILGAACLTPFLMAFYAWISDRDIRRYEEWGRLEIR
jgi:hypothetical protein